MPASQTAINPDSSIHFMESPLGPIVLRTDGQYLTGLYFSGQKHCPDLRPSGISMPGLLRQAEQQIQDFFSGYRTQFDLPLRPAGTLFQRRVWQGLLTLQYGEVISYAELAQRIGLGSEHARAVGSANGRNPLSIIVPCHRVVGSNGTLTGYAGGTERKQRLLELECCNKKKRAEKTDKNSVHT